MAFWGMFVWNAAEYADLIARLTRIEIMLKATQTQETKMAVDLASLTAEVTRNTTVQQSVVALVQSLAAQIAAIPASSDPTTQAALDALKATLSSNDDAIAAAVTANTPAAT